MPRTIFVAPSLDATTPNGFVVDEKLFTDKKKSYFQKRTVRNKCLNLPLSRCIFQPHTQPFYVDVTCFTAEKCDGCKRTISVAMRCIKRSWFRNTSFRSTVTFEREDRLHNPKLFGARLNLKFRGGSTRGRCQRERILSGWFVMMEKLKKKERKEDGVRWTVVWMLCYVLIERTDWQTGEDEPSVTQTTTRWLLQWFPKWNENKMLFMQILESIHLLAECGA